MKNKPAVAGLVYLFLCILLAVFSYPLMPDSTRNGNFQVREAAFSPPGSSRHVLLRPSFAEKENESAFNFLINGRKDRFLPLVLRDGEAWSIREDTLFYCPLNGNCLFELLPVFLRLPDMNQQVSMNWKVQTGKPYRLEEDTIHWVDANGAAQKASLKTIIENFRTENYSTIRYRLGSDNSGRDVLSRLILGTRVSISVGLMAVAVSLLIGIFLGSIAGLFRGWVDVAVMWFVTVVWSIPTLLLAISISFALGQGFWQLFIAIGLSMWVDVARMVRGQIFTLREMQYVEAAKVMGFRAPRILLKHILPNTLGPVLIVAASNFATAILLEAGLSFLGVGVKPPVPSWGSMIYEGYSQVMFDSGKWLAIFPGLAIVLMVISVNLVGFGLRDALDPKHEASV